MSSAQGAMASGGLLGANSASESNYMGQMEQLSGTLGLISAAISGLSTAAGAAGSLGDVGEGIMETATDMLTGSAEGFGDFVSDKLEKYVPFFSLSKPIKDAVENATKWVYNKVTGKKEKVVDRKLVDNAERTQMRMDAWNRFKGEIHG